MTNLPTILRVIESHPELGIRVSESRWMQQEAFENELFALAALVRGERPDGASVAGIDRRRARRAADDPRARALEGLHARPERRSRAVVHPTPPPCGTRSAISDTERSEMVTYGKRRLLAAFALTTVGAVVLAGCSGGSEPEAEEESGPVTLTLTTNSITGGKNSAEADWIADWVIPEFEKAMEADGKDVTVEFQPQGVDDEDYKTKIALDLQSGKGADIIGMDGIWVGEFAEAGYIAPLSDVGGKSVDDWDGWAQIPDAVQNALSFDGDRYGVPQGADGRVLYYNKDLFAQAGLDEDWAPESWDDILDASRDLKKLDGVTPIQLNAGTAMGEATTMQGLLPVLVGTGEQVYEDGKWIGATDGMEKALDLYETIYVDEGLGDPVLQQEASGRDTSFQLFAEGKIGILLEGDYFWRSGDQPHQGRGHRAHGRP